MTINEMDNVIQDNCYGDCDNCLIKKECDIVSGIFLSNVDICEQAYKKIVKSYDKVNDNVEYPAHYNQGNIECIDAMLSAFGKEKVQTYCHINAFKYLWRKDFKNGTEDIKKAIWYLKKYVDLEEQEGVTNNE